MEADRTRREGRTSGLDRVPGTIVICAASAVIWLVLLAQDSKAIWESPLGRMALRTDHFDLRSLLTYHLLHENWIHLLLGIGLVAHAGRHLELRWGTLRFIAFYLAAATACGLAVHGADFVLRSAADAEVRAASVSFGSAGAAFACIAAYILIAEDRPVIGFFTERYLLWSAMLFGAAGLLVLENVWRRIDLRTDVLLWPQISGIAIGMVLAVPISRWARPPARKESRDPGGRETIVQIRVRVDQILEKISRDGIASLSDEERRFLRSASKHFRNLR
jgi:membrane associated rhomboid family serine protease